MPLTGDFGRLTGTIAALRSLSKVPSAVAALAAPKLTRQMQGDARSGRDPYGNAYAPHMPATVKRWGPHRLLQLRQGGLATLKAEPSAGAGINITADQHMTFTQTGTPTQVVRAIMPNNPSLPTSYRRILEECSERVIAERLKVAK